MAKMGTEVKSYPTQTYFVVVLCNGTLLGAYCNHSRQSDPKLFRYRGRANTMAKRNPGSIVRECRLSLGDTFTPVEDYRKCYGHGG